MERRIGFLSEVTGHTFDIVYDLIFTTERVLALIVHHPADLPMRFGLKEMLFGDGMSRKIRRLEPRESPEERLARYPSMSREELLAHHRFNFEIPYRMVKRVEIRKGRFQRRLIFWAEGPAYPRGTVRFGLTKGQVAEAEEIIARAFPEGRPFSEA
jgi:hypothetical protein